MRSCAAAAAASCLLFASAGAQSLAPARRLTLTDAVELAQRQGHAARAAADAREAARYRYRAFNARLLPRLGLQGTVPDVSRAIVPVTQPDGSVDFRLQSQTQSALNLTLAQQIPWTGTSVYVASRLTRLDRKGDVSSRLFQSSPFGFGLSQQILRPNTLKWDGRERNISSDVAERTYIESREDVALATTGAFFDAYVAQLSLENASANASVNDTLFTLSKGRFEVGKIGENDLLQSELALLRARASLDDARLSHARALATLRLQLGLAPGTAIELEPPTELPTFVADTARAVTEAMKNRSLTRELDLQDVQARRRVNEARLTNGFNATVNAFAGLNQSAPELGRAYESLLSTQRFTLNVDMPIVQWGAHRADIQAARAEQDRVGSLARSSRETMAQEAHFAALSLVQSRRQVELSAKADTVAAKRFEVAKQRYVIGKIGIDNLYMAQSEKDQARQAYAQSLRGYWVAYYRLRRTTLFDFRTETQLR